MFSARSGGGTVSEELFICRWAGQAAPMLRNTHSTGWRVTTRSLWAPGKGVLVPLPAVLTNKQGTPALLGTMA